MLPPQLALVERLLHVIHAECVRSPAATTDAAHLQAVLLDRLLADGHGVLEPSSASGVGRLLRLVDEVVRVERVPVPARPRDAGRASGCPDLRVWTPDRLDVELFARGAFRAATAPAARLLDERLRRISAGRSDVLLFACDRRAYDLLRRGPDGRASGPDADEPAPDARRPELAALLAAVLPRSASLGQSFDAHEADLGRGQRWTAVGAVTPMVFGVQRVVLALRPRSAGRAAPAGERPPAQLDAFAP